MPHASIYTRTKYQLDSRLIDAALDFARAVNEYADSIEKVEVVFVRNLTDKSICTYKGEEIVIFQNYIFGIPGMLNKGDKVFVNIKAYPFHLIK